MWAYHRTQPWTPRYPRLKSETWGTQSALTCVTELGFFIPCGGPKGHGISGRDDKSLRTRKEMHRKDAFMGAQARLGPNSTGLPENGPD